MSENQPTSFRSDRKAYREANLEKLKAQEKAWRDRNKEKLAARDKAYREKNKEKLKAIRQAYEKKNRDMLTEKHRLYYQANKERMDARTREYEEANKERLSEQRRNYQRLKKYGVTPEAFDAMVRATGGRCPCCKLPFSTIRAMRPCVDHCHKSDTVRGVVCLTCNLLLGHAGDNPEILKACARYLTGFGLKRSIS
jgi:hypothetical protein